MTESFLHYLWKMKLLRNRELHTDMGEKVQIIFAGEYNKDAGPDFLNAKIKINDTLWVGNVEMHLKSSAWKLHDHQNDTAYDNIILHIVYENDQDVFRKDGSLIPCLEIKDSFDESIFETYQSLMRSPSWIPCERHLKKVSSITMHQWLHRLMIERLEEKIQPIIQSLEENGNNWEETFYQFLAQAYGAKVNAEPFRLLARSLPVKVLAKHKNNLFQLEALLFGTAGFLDSVFDDDYPNQLKKEFDFLKKKYDLKPMKKYLWKFLRLRPANFPTVRIAQFAQLVFNSSHLFSKILEAGDVKAIQSFFEATPSEYWLDHYRFDKISSKRKKPFGDTATDLLLINMISPFLFVYGKYRDEEQYISRALELLEQVGGEKNQIIENWNRLGIKAGSSLESQALLQLRNNYCKNFRCLDCAIGHKILSSDSGNNLKLNEA